MLYCFVSSRRTNINFKPEIGKCSRSDSELGEDNEKATFGICYYNSIGRYVDIIHKNIIALNTILVKYRAM